MKSKTTADWMIALEAEGVPCGPINTIDQVFADPQVIHRGLRMNLPHSATGTVPQVANPIRYSRTPLEYRCGPPVLGEHTEDVLKMDLGLDAERIAELKRKGVL